MRTFLRVYGETMNECYITKVTDSEVYYGHVIPGHENKQATGVMTLSHYRNLFNRYFGDDNYIIGEEL